MLCLGVMDNIGPFLLEAKSIAQFRDKITTHTSRNKFWAENTAHVEGQ